MEAHVLVDGLSFPEAPRWRAGRLWFSDFYTHRVLACDLDGTTEQITEVPQQPSGLGWLPDGSMLVVSMLDRRVMRYSGGDLDLYADITELASGPANDMVVDSAGRAYVGNMGYDRRGGETPRLASLACVQTDGRVTLAAEGLTFPNGMAITDDGGRLIVAETFAHRLTAFDIHPNGTLSNRQLFADLADAAPDGICLDAEGAVWVAELHGVRRVFEGGRVGEQWSTGARSVFACMLGGADRRTLFLCTNDCGKLSDGHRSAGRIETIRVSVPGAGLP